MLTTQVRRPGGLPPAAAPRPRHAGRATTIRTSASIAVWIRLQAAKLNVNIPSIWTSDAVLRQENAARYTELFTAAGLHRHLVLPQTLPGMRHVWNQYVDSRAEWGSEVAASRVRWPKPKSARRSITRSGCTSSSASATLDIKPEDLPETARAAEEVLAAADLPRAQARRSSSLSSSGLPRSCHAVAAHTDRRPRAPTAEVPSSGNSRAGVKS